VEHVEDAPAALEDLRQDARVDPRQRDVRPEPVDHERAQREPDPVLEVGRLGEGSEIDTGSELFGGRRHRRSSSGRRRCRPNPWRQGRKPASYSSFASFRAGSASPAPLPADAAPFFTMTLPPAFSTASIALFEAPATSTVTL